MQFSMEPLGTDPAHGNVTEKKGNTPRKGITQKIATYIFIELGET